MRIGIPAPRAFCANVVTTVSSIPIATFAIVFDVAGAIRRRSAVPSVPTSSMYGTEPSIRVIGSRPVAKWRAFGWTISVASLDRTGTTSAPWRISSRESFTVSTAAMLPVIPRTICFPFSFSDFAPWMRFAGCTARRTLARDLYLWQRRGTL